MTWLVTGGAGYIGSHVVRAFEADGIDSVVIDDLSSGHREFVDAERAVRQGNVVDRAVLHEICRRPRRSTAWSTWPASSTRESRSRGPCTPTPRTSPG